MRSQLGVVFVVATLGGCGGAHGAARARFAASAALEEAKAVGAEQLAPYEYYSAKERLEQAEVDAAQASDSDAERLLVEAEQYAHRAVDLAQAARQGRPDGP